MRNSPTKAGDADVAAVSAFSGLRNDVPAERFGRGDLVAATNIDIDKSGRLSRRQGCTSVNPGAAHSLWANDEQTLCLVARGAALLRMTPGYSTVQIALLTAIGARVSYCQSGERTYYSNGTDSGVIENGVARSWGIKVPPLPGATLTIGTMPAGVYQFVMTWVRKDGQESGAPLAGVIQVPEGGGLIFTLPVSDDSGVTSKRLYLSTPDGDALFQAFETSNTTTTARYTDDTLDLAIPLDTQFMGPPPTGQLVAHYQGRMWVAVGDTLYPSEPYAHELFDLRNFLTFDARITMLAVMEDRENNDTPHTRSGFFLGTEKTCGVIVGGSPDDFSYVPKTNYGAIFGALDYVDGALFDDNSLGARALPMWLTTQGICVGKPGMEIANLTRTKFSFTAAGQGAAVFVAGPNRFIATSNY